MVNIRSGYKKTFAMQEITIIPNITKVFWDR